MAQKLYNDKIGSLSHSAGNILMAASVSNPAFLTIGGQQFRITSQLSVSLPAMSANTRYQVYAVHSGGVVSLVISLNENSVGPAGYSRWKLVGSLYSSGASTFGTFLTISGTPTTISPWNMGVISVTASTPPTKGTIVTDATFGKRIGNKLFYDAYYQASAAGTAGSGEYIYTLPFSADSQKHAFSAPSASFINPDNPKSKIGSGYISTQSSSRGELSCFLVDSLSTYRVLPVANLGTQSVESNANFSYSATTKGFQHNIEYEVSGWSSIPIEDR